MDSVVTAGLMTGGSGVLLLAMLLLVRLRAYRIVWQGEESEDEGFSLARYQPMTRLLEEDDFVFLASQPGYRPEIGAKLRRERRRIFRMYLRELAGDFHRLHAEARRMVAESHAENAELVSLLIRQQVTFWRAMAGVELRLAMEWTGLPGIDVRGLVEDIELMRLDLLRVAAPSM